MLSRSKLAQFISAPFTVDSALRSELFFVFLVINLIVLVNTINHNPREGYDAHHQTKYIKALSKANLPTSSQTQEYFLPPLPYTVPAIIYRGCIEVESKVLCTQVAGKAGQISNFFLSVGTTYLILLICAKIDPTNVNFRLLSLIFIGILPVYYKTFAFVRGEPYVVFFSLIVYYIVILLQSHTDNLRVYAVILPLLIAALLLSKQWGFMVMGAIAIIAILRFLISPDSGIHRRTHLIILVTIFAGVLLSAVGYYAVVMIRERSAIPFPRESEEWKLSNQSIDFYFGTGNGYLFSSPTRPNFDNQILPIFYTEIWGDYWNYFTITREDISEKFVNYLGRVNIVSLLPTIMIIIGVVGEGIRLIISTRSGNKKQIAYFAKLTALLIIVVSLAAYFWILVRYPIHDGDTIKATYMLHIFPFAGILSAAFITRSVQKSEWAFRSIVIILILTFIHNLPAMISRYS
jgi:hypothetical protein